MPENQYMPGATSCSPGLFVEIGMRLTIKSCSANESVVCELIGMRCGKYLILRILKDNYSDEFHIKETPITVKCTCAGCVFGFSSRIIQYIDSPDKLFFVETMESEEAVGDDQILHDCNERIEKRIPCFVRVHLSSGETVIEAVVDNISTKGCHCLVIDDFLNNSFKMYPLVNIQFSSKLSIDGEVRFIERKFSQHHLGISFTDIDDDTKRKLMELIPALRF
jgi:hypothetical protein